MADFDLILAGGGLASGLIAMRLADVRPNLSVAIVEADERLGGDHIWSSFDSDMRPVQRLWTNELYAHVWDRYEVRFPAYRRELGTGYASARSERVDAAVRARLPEQAIFTGRRIEKVTAHALRLEDGTLLEGHGLIDCRGFGALGPLRQRHLQLAWQKFVGLEIETARPHGVERPVIMDAAVPQLGGYRFVYMLPTSTSGLMVEDTYYAGGEELDQGAVLARIRDYIARLGVGGFTEGRTETGVLPIVLDGDIEAFWDEGEPVPRAGMAGAFFHPLTGYSFPDAVALADLIKGSRRIDSRALYDSLRAESVRKWGERGFYRLLNRMMFRVAAPTERYRMLQHFYALDEALVERFYAGRSTFADKLRIFSGKPPVPVTGALGELWRSRPRIRFKPRWQA